MPQLSNLTITGSLIAGYVVTVTTNVGKGTAYLVAVPAGEQAPSKVQIAAGQNYQGNAAVAQQTSVGSTEITFPAITGLSSNTSYDVHCIHDASPVISGLIEGMDSTPMPSGIPRPAKGAVFTDPTYGTEIHRITDHVNDIDLQTIQPAGVMPAWVRNTYSRIQPFNVDETYLFFYSSNGFIHLYDANTYQWVRNFSLGGGACEPQWHETDPLLLYKFPNNGGFTISTHNVLTDATVVVADFRNVVSIEGDTNITDIRTVIPTAARIWTKEEGSPSADKRYWGLMIDNADFQGVGFMVYDMQTNTITGVYSFADDATNGISRCDHISMSITGNWVVPSWHVPNDCPNASKTGLPFYDPAGKGTLTEPCGLMAFNRDITVAVPLNGIGPHSDICLDENGDDWIVYVHYQEHSAPNDDGWVRATKLSTGETIDLYDVYNGDGGGGIHISGRAFNKPGWVLVSTYGSTVSWFETKVFAIEIKANPKVYVLAHTHWVSTDDGYWGETHAVVNKDFSRILFNTTWESGLITDLEVFEIKINPADLVGSV